jgi:hypothetical protein
MSHPVVFAAPADVELAPNPINPDWIIEGKPVARAVMAWSCTPGQFALALCRR